MLCQINMLGGDLRSPSAFVVITAILSVAAACCVGL